jgi:hypothetical protein
MPDETKFPKDIIITRGFVAAYDEGDEQYYLEIPDGKPEQKYVRADLHQAALDALEDALKLIDQLLDERGRRPVHNIGSITVRGAEVILVDDILRIVGGAISG